MNLVLFTTTFPYEGGEQFLETEVEFLAKVFNKIVIVPAKANKKIRKIPKNIIIDNYISKMNKSNFNRIKNLFDKKFLLNLTTNYSSNRYLAIRIIYINRYLKWLKDFETKYYNIDFKNTIFYTYWFDSATTALSLAKRKNKLIKFVTRTHGKDLYESEHNFQYFPMRKEALKNINRVFSISSRGKEHLISKYKIDRKKVIVSKLGIKPHGFKSKPSEDGVLRVVSCSSLIEVKRVHIIIEALNKLVDRDVNILWTHIGDGVLKKDLEKKAKKILIRNIKYKFLGKLNNKDVYKFYRDNRVDLFINVSRSEGIPVSIMEAQSFGIACIATNVGANREIVNNENGILLSSNPSPKDIANIFLNYFKRIEIWNQKRKKSFKSWQINYNALINYKLFCNKLKEIYYE